MLDMIEPVLIIRVSKLYRESPSMTEIELFEITRGVWRLGERKNNIEYVFSVYDGIILEVYRVLKWFPALTLTYETRSIQAIKTVKGEKINMDGRWEFNGKIADEKIRSKYIGKSVKHLFPQGASNPVKYINC